MKTQLKFWAILASLLIGSFATGAQAVTFNVSAVTHSINNGANLLGFNTGIVVTPGRLITISADRNDTWSIGPLPAQQHNANGSGNPFGSLGQINVTLPGTNFTFLAGSLVGSLDNGKTFFPIGTRMEQTILKAGTSGVLRLYFWDSDFANNTGTVAVNVQTYSGPN